MARTLIFSVIRNLHRVRFYNFRLNINIKSRPLILHTFNINRTAQAFHDHMHDAESQTGALINRFGGKKRLEIFSTYHLSKCLFRYPILPQQFYMRLF